MFTETTEFETYTTTVEQCPFWTNRDKYGRTCHQTNAYKGIICALPRRTAHLRPAGENYLVNLHDVHVDETGKVVESTVRYFPTLKAAKAFLVSAGTLREYRRVLRREVVAS